LLVTGTQEEVDVDAMHRSVDYAQKSVRCLMQDNAWDKIIDKTKTVVEYTLNLCQRKFSVLFL